jgi:hypothetical protein
MILVTVAGAVCEPAPMGQFVSAAAGSRLARAIRRRRMEFVMTVLVMAPGQ